MLNALWVIGYCAFLLKCYFYQPGWFYIYLVLLVAFTATIFKLKNPRDNPKRKTLMIATWHGKSLLIFRIFRPDLLQY